MSQETGREAQQSPDTPCCFERGPLLRLTGGRGGRGVPLAQQLSRRPVVRRADRKQQEEGGCRRAGRLSASSTIRKVARCLSPRRYYILLHGDPVRRLSMFKGSIHPLNISSLHVHGVPSPELLVFTFTGVSPVTVFHLRETARAWPVHPSLSRRRLSPAALSLSLSCLRIQAAL